MIKCPATENPGQENNTLIQTSCEIIKKETTKAKGYYDLILKEKSEEIVALKQWQNCLALPETFDWQNVFLYKFHEIKDNEMKQFNFKLLHRI